MMLSIRRVLWSNKQKQWLNSRIVCGFYSGRLELLPKFSRTLLSHARHSFPHWYVNGIAGVAIDSRETSSCTAFLYWTRWVEGWRGRLPRPRFDCIPFDWCHTWRERSRGNKWGGPSNGAMAWKAPSSLHNVCDGNWSAKTGRSPLVVLPTANSIDPLLPYWHLRAIISRVPFRLHWRRRCSFLSPSLIPRVIYSTVSTSFLIRTHYICNFLVPSWIYSSIPLAISLWIGSMRPDSPFIKCDKGELVVEKDSSRKPVERGQCVIIEKKNPWIKRRVISFWPPSCWTGFSKVPLLTLYSLNLSMRALKRKSI